MKRKELNSNILLNTEEKESVIKGEVVKDEQQR